MRIINVVESVGGNICSIKSWIIADTKMEKRFWMTSGAFTEEEEAVKLAEEDFTAKLKENTLRDITEQEIQTYIDDGIADFNGYEVRITWSEVVTK